MSTPVILLLTALGFMALVITGAIALAKYHNRPPLR